jgi:hypothetical protein
MTSAPVKPAIGPHTEPSLGSRSTAEPALSRSENQPFRALIRVAHPLPSWDQYDAASPQDRAAIERQWKDNWRSHEAQQLYQHAIACRAAESQVGENYAADHSARQPARGEFTRKLSFDEQTALHATDPAQYRRYLDWLFALNAPATKRWGLREFLHPRDLDREREITRGDDYEMTPEQFGWRNR